VLKKITLIIKSKYMNPDLNRLQDYPFVKLRALKAGITPPADSEPVLLSIGEPKHATSDFIQQALIDNLGGLANYPLTKGIAPLREAIARWIKQRFHASLDAETQILPVNGTREALFAFAQTVIDRSRPAKVLMPNPFYQIYEGAALLAGAEPVFLNCTAETGFLPDFDSVSVETWQACQLIYICSPNNPSGAVISRENLAKLIHLAQEYDFVIAADECYSELYFDETQPPVGLLQVAAELGLDDFKNCVVFHSLSKRSNVPGLRSGFVAGDAQVIERFLLYRTYHGSAMALPQQAASTAAWADEKHVKHNRDLYRAKFQAVHDILSPVIDCPIPAASFYLWLHTPVADPEFARALFQYANITVLPGSYLSRETEAGNPGANYVRIALVAPLDDCVRAAKNIRWVIENKFK
jgi:N-succinyldiaminopimelate aminotransferase